MIKGGPYFSAITLPITIQFSGCEDTLTSLSELAADLSASQKNLAWAALDQTGVKLLVVSAANEELLVSLTLPSGANEDKIISELEALIAQWVNTDASVVVLSRNGSVLQAQIILGQTTSSAVRLESLLLMLLAVCGFFTLWMTN